MTLRKNVPGHDVQKIVWRGTQLAPDPCLETLRAKSRLAGTVSKTYIEGDQVRVYYSYSVLRAAEFAELAEVTMVIASNGDRTIAVQLPLQSLVHVNNA